MNGWVVDTVTATKYALMTAPNNPASTAFTSGSPLSSATGPGLGDSFRTELASSTTYASGTWAFTIAVLASSANSQKGHLRMRVWASTSSAGTSPRELTGSIVAGNVTPAMTVAFTSYDASLSWSAPSITLSAEYLFFQFEWAIDQAGSGSGSDVKFSVGSCYFTTSSPAAPQIQFVKMKQYLRR